MKIKLFLVGAIYLLFCLSLSAENHDKGVYGSAFGGIAIVEDGRVDVKSLDSGDADFAFDNGQSAGLRLGYDLGRYRLEGEYSHFQADIDQLETSTGTVFVDSGISNQAFMLNALVDFKLGPVWFSAGLGAGRSKIKLKEMANAGFIAVAETDHSVSSYQTIIQVGFNLNKDTTIGVSHRYLMSPDLEGAGYVDSEGGGLSDIFYDGIDASLIDFYVSYRF